MDSKQWCNGQTVHIAFVVKDIETVVENYCRLFNLEKPIIKLTGEPETAKVEYRGNASKTRARQSFLQMGNVRIEFLEPDENDSTWKEYLDKYGTGFHHIAFEVDDMDEALQTLEGEQIRPVQQGQYNGGQYAYVESEEKLAVMLELLQNYH